MQSGSDSAKVHTSDLRNFLIRQDPERHAKQPLCADCQEAAESNQQSLVLVQPRLAVGLELAYHRAIDSSLLHDSSGSSECCGFELDKLKTSPLPGAQFVHADVVADSKHPG